MSEETNIKPSPAAEARAALVKRLEGARDKLDAGIIAGFNRHHPDADERHWKSDFPHENGMYENRCFYCTKHFLGHKRRVVCFKCANPKLSEPINGEGEV